MLRGFYTAASGMIANQRYQEALSNNISNADTPGYKADQATLRSFPELLLRQTGGKHIPTIKGLNKQTRRPIGSINTGVYVQEMIPNFMQGDLKETGVGTDLALVHGNLPDEAGSLFFTVQNENGEIRLTRNGNFTVDPEGYLATNQGYYVLDQAGNPIQTFGMEFNVTTDGMIQIGDQNIPLGISYTANANELVKEGDGLYSGQVNPMPANAQFTVQQGFIERSTVDTLQTMTDMMQAYRMFETNQRVLRAYDESMGKAVNEIGKLG